MECLQDSGNDPCQDIRDIVEIIPYYKQVNAGRKGQACGILQAISVGYGLHLQIVRYDSPGKLQFLA